MVKCLICSATLPVDNGGVVTVSLMKGVCCKLPVLIVRRGVAVVDRRDVLMALQARRKGMQRQSLKTVTTATTRNEASKESRERRGKWKK